MSSRLYPHNRIKYGRSYDMDEICILFKDKNLHIQTVRSWVKKGGLKAIDTRNPKLIYGYDLIQFLQKRNDIGKCKTEFHEMYCMSCKDARPVFKKSVCFEQKANGLNVKAHCQKCKALMFKAYKVSDIQSLKRIFRVVDVSQLYDCDKSTLMTHNSNKENNHLIESQQGSLF